MKQEIVIGVNEKDQRLDRFIRKLFRDVQLNVIFRDIRKGNIKVNGSRKSIDYKLKQNDILRIFGYHYDLYSNRDRLVEGISDYNDYVKPKVCYEDSNILIVLKDLNTIVHSNGDDSIRDLTKDVRIYLSKKGDYSIYNNLTFTPSPVNRLDRNTYGLVIFGKNNISLNELNNLVRERKINKYYQALVQGKIKDGIYTAYIKKDTNTNKSSVFNKKIPDSKKIQMGIKVIDTNGVVSLLDINLMTGRSHQIRSHLRFLNNPLIGDIKYGSNELKNYFFNKYGVQSQLLFAYKIVFRDIDKSMSISYLNNKTIVAPLPSRFKRIIKQEFKIMF